MDAKYPKRNSMESESSMFSMLYRLLFMMILFVQISSNRNYTEFKINEFKEEVERVCFAIGLYGLMMHSWKRFTKRFREKQWNWIRIRSGFQVQEVLNIDIYTLGKLHSYMTEKKVLIRVLQQLIDGQKDKQEIEKINDQTKENEIGNLVSDDELQEEKPVDDPLVSDSDEEIQTPLCSKYISVLRSSLHSFRFVKEEQKEECM